MRCVSPGHGASCLRKRSRRPIRSTRQPPTPREAPARLAPHGWAGGEVNAEVGYGLPVGTRFVGTPRVGYSASQYGPD